ncbi:MAG: aminotransferase class I/II-fold pyridoxal phosphate-dependent enzyme, partial [Rhizobium sp.]|nr:aminotransferase class I/II-fold pyridoxal phosphate-dependent enzyme [Rhizobium sp.]
MDESKRQFILNRMKGLQKDVEAGRRVRTENAAAQAPVRKQPGFSDLPEYKQVVMQQLAGQQMGMENPFYRAHEGASGATALIGGRSFDNFASYDYLGLNHHPKVLARASEALQTFGVSASASRVVAGERTIHTVLEEKIADVYDAQAAVCFVSGYLTNVAGISSLVGPKDLVIHDEFIHNSALAGIKLSGATRRFFKHNDIADLDRVLKTLAGDYERILVIVEGVYSMDGDIADLPALLRLKEQYGFWLMVDEAHSLGVLGETGRGVFEHFGIAAGEVDIWMGTLSKTSCSCGGYIAGSEALVTLLKAQAGGFVY